MIPKGIYYKDKPIIKAYKGNEVIYGREFDPLVLFKDGKQGVWYDPSDKSTLFQDVAGTVPVTANGDPVGLMKDKSGNGNHATQAVSTARPIYKTDGVLHWLQFDGVDDYFTHKLTHGGDMTLASAFGLFNSGHSYRQQIISLGAPNTRLSSLLWASANHTGRWGTYTTDNTPSSFSALNNPLVAVITGDTTTSVQTLYTNLETPETGTGMYSGDDSERRHIGREIDNNTSLNGRIFGIVACSWILSESDRIAITNYLATKSGVTL